MSFCWMSHAPARGFSHAVARACLQGSRIGNGAAKMGSEIRSERLSFDSYMLVVLAEGEAA